MLFIDQLQYMHFLLLILLHAGGTKSQVAMLILLTKVDFFSPIFKGKGRKALRPSTRPPVNLPIRPHPAKQVSARHPLTIASNL